MDKILFDQIPDLFASVGNLFIEKKEDYAKWMPVWVMATSVLP